jgi:hypothetical protein
MKGVSQGKTSPLPAVSILLCDGQPPNLRVEASARPREGTFVIPNLWNSGSARLLAGLGFEALATTSAGLCSY